MGGGGKPLNTMTKKMPLTEQTCKTEVETWKWSREQLKGQERKICHWKV